MFDVEGLANHDVLKTKNARSKVRLRVLIGRILRIFPGSSALYPPSFFYG